MSLQSRLRRQLVLGSSAAVLAAPINAAQRALTPSQMLGPFYPVTPPLHKDNDLTQVEGRSARAAGQIADLMQRSERSVRRDWQKARLFLLASMRED